MTDTTGFAALERREWSDPNVARAYAQAFAKASDMVVPALVAAVRAGSGTRALDLCCGHGNVSAGLVGAGAEVTGVDFSPAMLEMARIAVPGARFVEGDAMALEFEDGTFDAVTIGFGVPHVPDPPQVLAEARRVLKPGGRLAFSVWCGAGAESALGYVFEAIAAHGDPGITLPPGPGATDYADPALAFPVLEARGFAGCHCETVPSAWKVDDPAAPYVYFLEGTARGGALLRPQPEENATAIRASVVERVLAAHGTGPEWRVPIPANVTSAEAV
ncbi:methyltransferase domain-containing protein [Marinibacterium profundimaris]|uniref:Ubiquinone biosynthesis protein UbiE n=1 Tax=Marinibacterium profundimaris TaxID=1679460 RepID=A0A225NI58_9RHOB|nr:methyltransferase domain-containing protein [Marinibacterium profundimaris]OWU73496.1 ubiquinone biosynthesis protein UbiE [Marinibacterium profundimaris]